MLQQGRDWEMVGIRRSLLRWGVVILSGSGDPSHSIKTIATNEYAADDRHRQD